MVNGKVVSYDREYKFYPSAKMTITAVFATEGEDLEYKALVSIDNTAQEDVGIRVYYSWYTPVEQAGFTHQAAGLIYVSEADYVADNFVMDATGVQKATTSNEVAAGSANARKKMAAGETWYFRAWVQYLDANGNVCVEYSDAVKTTMA